jgi:hypothetical protein
MTTRKNTRIYLLYYNEDISDYVGDSRIMPLRLDPQTVFCESEAFRIIKESDIPEHIQYIGFITPSFLRKTGLTLADIAHPGTEKTLVAFHKGWDACKHTNYVDMASRAHPYFAPIWAWLMHRMNIKAFSFPYSCNHIYCNMWLTDKHTALDYMRFARLFMAAIMTAPVEIKELIHADSTYRGKRPTENLLSVFGRPYYTYHPFLMERCIMLYCDLRKIHVV